MENSEQHPEEDPTAVEPDEAPKPPIEDMPPEEGVEPPSDDEEEDVGEHEFMTAEDAESDDTVDDAEDDSRPE